MNYKKTKYTCYFTYLALASVFCWPPMLFVTFREMYGISYTLLGTLVLTNFCTQLTVDLIFTFFTKYFNIHKTLKVMPLLTSLGLVIYALMPTFFPKYAYVGFLTGTVIFSVASGLSEVLLSPVVAAIPSENPERDMSMLHSLYGYGVVGVVCISTLFIMVFGTENWMYLTLFWALLPIIACVLFCTSPMPEMNLIQSAESGTASKRHLGLALCAACIFLGGATENVMTNWISGYLENALHISKTVGDILGLALFAILLATGRSVYGKYGKNVHKILMLGMAGSVACYLIAGLSANGVISMVACVFVGLTASMLWPGTLILMEEKMPAPGVAAYALMAAGGDLGSSVAPQLMGIISDTAAASSWAAELGTLLSLTAEQIGMKTGMVISAIFPLIGCILLVYMKKYFHKQG